MEAKPASSDAGATPTQGSLPLLYRRIEPLNPARHSELKLRNANDYALARNAGIIPITLGEFALVARQYPIVFQPSRPGAPPLAAAAMGMGPTENLFVGADGHWQPGFYVPAYLRRYPFITGDTEEAARKAVYLDVESPRVSRDEGVALYANGELSKVGQSAIEFCRQYHSQVLATAPFNAAMAAADVLVAKAFPTVRGTKPRQEAPGMLMVDEKKLAEVDGATFLDWRAKGWIGMLYLHLFSIGNFATMLQLKQRLAKAAADVMPVGTA